MIPGWAPESFKTFADDLAFSFYPSIIRASADVLYEIWIPSERAPLSVRGKASGAFGLFAG